MRRTVLAALCAAAAGVLVAGGVIAGTILQVPDGNKVFWACYDNGGNVRFVAGENSACPKNWNGPVSWNQVGQSAYQIALDNGFTGSVTEWLDSLVGPQGEQGIQGEKGEKGDTGPLAVLTGQQVRDTLPALPANAMLTRFSSCPDGYYPASGWMQLLPGVELVSSVGWGPDWRFTYRNLSVTDDVANPGYAMLWCLGTIAPPHTVSVTVTGGTLSTIDIRFPASDGTMCDTASACSYDYPDASYGAVILTNLSEFSFACDGVPQAPPTFDTSAWKGQCYWSPFSTDHTVTVQLPE